MLVSAGVHLYLWFDGFSDQNVIGPAFLLNAAGGLVIAVLLVTWRHWIPPLLALGFGVSTLGAFVVAATVGLFGVHEHWIGGRCGPLPHPRSWRSSRRRRLLVRTLPTRSGGQLQNPSTARRAHLN